MMDGAPLSNMQARDVEALLHPYTNAVQHRKTGPLIIETGEGVYVYDDAGNRYIEGMAGLWCAGLGFGDAELIDAAKEQLDKLPYYHLFAGRSYEPAIELAEKIKEVAPVQISKVIYQSSGSEANDTQIKLAWYYNNARGKPEKKKIISRVKGYHGVTIVSASLTGLPYNHKHFDLPVDRILHTGTPHFWREAQDGETEAEFTARLARELDEMIVREGPDTVAAFIAEPVQGAGGVIVAPDTYWPEIQRICDKYEILLIADEVICGFGRTGNWFGSQTVGIKPDIMTIAKGLSSGYAPIGGSIVNDEIAQVIGGTEFNHGYTYSGHPVAAAVALENLRILQEEKIVEHVRDVAAPYLKQKWEALADHPLVGEAKIVGMMASIALTPDKASRAKFASAPGTVGYVCRDRCFGNNLIMRHVGDRMIISPPLVLTPSDIDEMFVRIHKSLDEAQADIIDKGLMKAAS